MLRYGFGFLLVGFAAAFFGFAGVASASLGVARVLFLLCLVGFVATMAFVASESDRVSR